MLCVRARVVEGADFIFSYPRCCSMASNLLQIRLSLLTYSARDYGNFA